MNKIIAEQLNMLKNLEFQVDGIPSKEFPDSFSEVTFIKNGTQLADTSDKIVTFADYIINPYEGFDFHKKFNHDVPPPEQLMYGIIEKETEKMYYFNLKNSDGTKHWMGWCPKKSCKVTVK